MRAGIVKSLLVEWFGARMMEEIGTPVLDWRRAAPLAGSGDAPRPAFRSCNPAVGMSSRKLAMGASYRRSRSL